MKAASILETIGDTPHIRINRLYAHRPQVEVWMKAERANPGGSIKDRIGLSMIEDAERRGVLGPGSTIVEPTSGNTGIGLAMVAAVRGYRLILVMPESMSMERRRLMAAYGAQLELTPREGGMKAAIARADELVAQIDGAWMPQQFENPANPAIHRDATAQEILRDFPDGVDFLITGVGTGGHITGVSEALKERFPSLQTFAVEPDQVAGDQRRRAEPAPAAGHRRGLRARQPAHRHARRRDPGHRGGRLRVRGAGRARGGHLRRPVIGRRAGRGRAEAAGHPGRQHGADVLLRHRRAVLLRRGAVRLRRHRGTGWRPPVAPHAIRSAQLARSACTTRVAARRRRSRAPTSPALAVRAVDRTCVCGGPRPDQGVRAADANQQCPDDALVEACPDLDLVRSPRRVSPVTTGSNG